MARTIPRKIGDFFEWISTLMVWVLLNLIAKGFDSEFVKDKLEPAFNKLVDCFKVYSNKSKRSPEVIANLRRAREDLEPLAAIMVEMIKSNQLVTKADLDYLRIAIATGGGNQPSPPPVTYPVFTLRVIKTPSPGRLTIEYRDFGQKLEGKPAHVNHVKYACGVSDEIFGDRALLTEGGIDTASPIVKDFPYPQHGKKFGIAGCWVSNSGEEGPWSEIVWFTIP